MTNKIWYEGSADKPDYVYFQYFPDMAAAKYRFGELHIHQSVEILVVCDGRMRCMVNNQTEELSGGSVFIYLSEFNHSRRQVLSGQPDHSDHDPAGDHSVR